MDRTRCFPADKRHLESVSLGSSRHTRCEVNISDSVAGSYDYNIVTVSESILQLADDDSTRSTKLGGERRSEENILKSQALKERAR